MIAPEIVILADDLSGAADSAITLVNAGLDAEVLLGNGRSESSAKVVAVDANTRMLTATEAAARMYQLASFWICKRPTVIFKKIDSTLRGHVAAEIAAVLSAMRNVHPDAVAVLAPALPAMGRTTVGGVHLLHGRPLHETEMWMHERITWDAHLPRSLERGGLRCRHLTLNELRGASTFTAVDLQSTDVIVCDAVEEADLAAVAALAAGLNRPALWVGSSGLAPYLTRVAGAAPAVRTNKTVLLATRPALFVLGSVGRRAREQADTLRSHSRVRSFSAAPDVLLGGPSGARWKMLADGLRATLILGEDALLMSDSQPAVEPQDRSRLSLALGEMTGGLQGYVGTLIACGGETARSVLDRWGLQVLRPVGELEAGVPISQAVLPEAPALTVLTKAGDFGHRETLLHCLRFAQGLEGSS